MTYDCEVIRDLMPLYKDGVLSDKSNAIVEEHIANCNTCKQELDSLIGPDLLDDKPNSPTYNPPVIKYAKKVRKVRVFLSLVFALLILSVLALGSLLLFFEQETKELAFDNYSSAKEYIVRGWLPEALPEKAVDIYVIYNLDTNIINGAFHLPKNQTEAYTRSLSPSRPEDLSNLPKALVHKWDTIRKQILASGKSNNLYSDTEFLYYVLDEKIYFWSK